MIWLGALREKWLLGLDPIPSMSALLEDKGIKVIEADLPDRFDGMACDVKRSDGKPDTAVVVVSNRTNIERKRFTLAHELAHRVIRATGNPSIDLEKAMNRFAGAFLVPGEHLIKEAGAHRARHDLSRVGSVKTSLWRFGGGDVDAAKAGRYPVTSGNRICLSQLCTHLASRRT